MVAFLFPHTFALNFLFINANASCTCIRYNTAHQKYSI